MSCKHVLACLFMAIGSACAVFGAPADDLATHLTTLANVPKGVCSIPACNDPAVALALARAGLIVHMMNPDAATVDAIRKQATDAGFLGTRLYVEQGTASADPFADDYVNLMIAADATDSSLAQAPAAEIERVLVPCTGTAIVGHAKSAAGTLSRSVLEAWAKGFKTSTTRIIEDDFGIWSVITKSPKAGAVAWTHRLFSPANNPVTPDTIAWPLMTQWLGKPYLAQEPVALIANGKMAIFRLTGWGDQGVLEVRDARNGVLLWRHTMTNVATVTRTSGMILMPDALYLCENSNVVILNPLTGAEIGRIDCSAMGGQVKWIALQDGTLYAMAGELEPGNVMAHQTWKVFSTAPKHFGRCSALGAYNLAARNWVWTQKQPADSLDESMVGLANGKIYYYVDGQSLDCCEAGTGKIVWQNPEIVQNVSAFKKGDTRGFIGAIVCTDKYIALNRASCGTVVVDAATGKLLQATMATSIVFYKDALIRKGGTFPFLDVVSGGKSTVLPALDLGGGCGAFTFSSNLICGQQGITYDLEAKKPLDNMGNGPLGHKTPCLSGWFVGEGLVTGASVTCQCGYNLRGTIVMAAAQVLPLKADENALLHHQNGGDKVTPFPVDANDWPTFRANISRGNASPQESPTSAKILWSWIPASRKDAKEQIDALDSCREPMQVTTAGNLAFATGDDGSVTALDATSGKPKWRFVTAARLYSPPTIANDRCYIGSGDGCIYCLEAASGQELWRYRVAPADRRIMVYGDLVSNWPITGGVVVKDNVAYAAAGIFDVDGTHVVALDATTGAIKWRNDTSGHIYADRNTGVSAVGYTTIAKGRLWIRTASYDLATGECRPWPVATTSERKSPEEKTKGTFQRYVGFFADQFLVFGGRRFFDDQSILCSDHADATAIFLQVGNDGMGKLPLNLPWSDCRTMPAWDEKNLVAMPAVTYSAYQRVREDELVCWDTAKAVAELSKSIDAGVHDAKLLEPYRGDLLKIPRLDRSHGEKFAAPQQTWTADAEWYVAAVLTSNAVVAAYGTKPANWKPTEKPFREVPEAIKLPYYLSAYDRNNGQVLWTIPLPSQPLMDGISIARDSTVLVRLLDGSVVAVGK